MSLSSPITLRSDCASVIDAGYLGRALHVSVPTGAAVIEGLVFRNGRITGGGDGGAVLVSSSSATFRDCRFAGSSTEFYGGGLHAEASLASLEACTFSLNTCAPPATGCGLMGARPVACGPVTVEETSWGRVKAAHRGARHARGPTGSRR